MLRPATIACCISVTVGCAVEDPEVHQAFDCIRDTADAVSRTGQAATANCVVPAPWTLIGLPAGATDKAALTHLGVAPGLVSLAANDSDDGAEWCMARELPVQQVPEGTSQTTAKNICVTWLPQARRLFVAPSGPVQVAIVKAESGQTQVITIGTP